MYYHGLIIGCVIRKCLVEREYLNCEISLTPQCPNINHESMQKLLIPPDKNNNILNDTHIKEANFLCKNCDSFVSVLT